MTQSNYEYYFQHSAVMQWVMQVQPFINFLQTHQLTNPLQIEEHLANSEQCANLRALLTVQEANQACLDLYQCKNLEEFSQFIRKVASKEQMQHLLFALLVMTDKNSRYAYQVDVPTPSGDKTLLVNCEVPALADVERGMNISITDISSLTDAEKELQEREQFLGAILKAVPDILMVFDFKAQKTIFQNADLIEQLGYSAQDRLDTDNQLMAYIIHPDDGMGKDAMLDIHQTLASGGTYEITIRLQHFNGEWRHYYFRSAALDKDKKGNVLSAVVIARDITAVLKTRQILSAQQKRYQLLADNFTDVIVITNTDLAIEYVSPSIATVLGFDADSFVKIEQPIQHLGLDDAFCQQLQTILDNSSARFDMAHEDYEDVLELDGVTVAGMVVPLEVSISILRDEYGLLEGLLMIVRDITERIKREAENRLAAKVFSSSLEGIYITNAEGVISQANRTFYSITGYAEKDVIGKKPVFLNSGWGKLSFRDDIAPALKNGGSWSGEIMSRRANGAAFLTWTAISEVRDARNQLIGTITSFRDITEAKNSEETIRKLAYYDPLTQLPNRQLLADRLSQALQRANRNRHYLAILFLDLDGFKPVNDQHGHAIGDRLLTMVAKRLKACVRGDDTVARIGGDEFAIIVGALADREAAETAAVQVSKKIIKSLNQVFTIQEKEIYIGTSIGISLYPDDALEDEQLIKLADTAMYHAKSSGKNTYQFFTDDMHKRAQKRLEVEQEVSQALKNKEFVLVYLPKYDLAQNKIESYEALLRWQHPQKGLLTPISFLRSLEEMGLGGQVGEWVIHQACEQMAANPQLNISINVFAKQYRDGDLLEVVEAALTKTAIEPNRLTLEISEQLIMADTGFAFACIADLKALGVRIALDDYANSVSSIAYLNRLPIDEVKIDRQYIEQIDRVPHTLRMVKGMVALAQNLELKVAVEGVERESQLDLLKAMQCDLVQGFYFSKPLFLEEL